MVEITAFRLERKSCKGFFLKINFPPMRALEFLTCHVIYNPAYTYEFQLKTHHIRSKSTTYIHLHRYFNNFFLKMKSLSIIFFIKIYLHRIHAFSCPKALYLHFWYTQGSWLFSEHFYCPWWAILFLSSCLFIVELFQYWKWYFVTKIVLTYCEKKLF